MTASIKSVCILCEIINGHLYSMKNTFFFGLQMKLIDPDGDQTAIQEL